MADEILISEFSALEATLMTRASELADEIAKLEDRLGQLRREIAMTHAARAKLEEASQVLRGTSFGSSNGLAVLSAQLASDQIHGVRLAASNGLASLTSDLPSSFPRNAPAARYLGQVLGAADDRDVAQEGFPTEHSDWSWLEMTLKEKIITVLRGYPTGLEVQDLSNIISSVFGEEVPRTSLSPQLSRMKQAGEVALLGREWVLAQYVGAPLGGGR
ncbi:MAG: hypothetical protein R3C52_11220 [Hyphomonadaceae bacterium]